MKNMKSALIIKWVCMICCILLPSFAEAQEYPRFLTDCGNEKSCVNMDINLGKKPADVTKRKELPGGYTDFLLKVRGKFSGKSEKVCRIWFRGYTDGMDCNDFGQGNVASRGFSSKGNPILLTDKGEFEVTDASLKTGCPDCLKLYDRKSRRLVKSVTSPGWDIVMAGYKMKNLSYNEKGEIFLRTENQCIMLNNKGRFKAVSPKNCAAEMENIGYFGKNAEGFVFEPAQWLFRIKGSRFLLFVEAGMCG